MKMLLRDKSVGGHIDNRQERDLFIFRIYAEPFFEQRKTMYKKFESTQKLGSRF
jgi:hypothetical protein